jgi:hypothetical protein
MTDNYELVGSIRRSLADIAELFDETLVEPRLTSGIKLPTVSVPGEKMKYAAKPVRHSPPPIELRVLEVRAAAYSDLVHWARVVLQEVTDINGGTIQTKIDPNDHAELAQFIGRWAERLASVDPLEAEVCEEEMRGHADALRAIVFPLRRDWVSMGDCPFVIEGAFCRGKVRGYGDGRLPSCDGCNQSAVAEWWEEVILGNPSLTTLTHADLIPFIHRTFGRAVKRATIRTWINRSVLVPSGTDEHGRTVFNPSAVVYALSQKFAA